MKIWKDSHQHLFIRGPRRGAVMVIGETSTYRLRGKILEYLDFEDYPQDRAWEPMDHWNRANIVQAITKLWPTKAPKAPRAVDGPWSIPRPKLWPPPDTVSSVLVYKNGWHRVSLDNFHAPTWYVYRQYHDCYWVPGLPPPPT